MIRLSHNEWSRLHKLSLQIQDVSNEQELIQRVVHYIPKAIGVNYSVWHEFDKNNPSENISVHMPKEYASALRSVENRFVPNLHTHPIISGLGIGRDLIFPEDRVYGMADFASVNEIKETSIMKEFYSHLEVRDNTCIQLIGAEQRNLFMCFNTMSEFSSAQKYSLQVLREHISVVMNRFRRNNDRTKCSQLAIPTLNYNDLVAVNLVNPPLKVFHHWRILRRPSRTCDYDYVPVSEALQTLTYSKDLMLKNMGNCTHFKNYLARLVSFLSVGIQH